MNTITIERHPNNDTRLPWREFTYDMDNGHDIARYIARERYAWPGGYELYAITDDGAVICNDCCKTEYYQIRTAYPGDGWNVAGYQSTAMDDCDVTCDHCNRVIFSSSLNRIVLTGIVQMIRGIGYWKPARTRETTTITTRGMSASVTAV